MAAQAATPRMQECHAGICRGRMVPLLSEMGRLISENNDFSGALDHLLDYMRVDLGMARAMISLHHRESGRIFVHKSLGLTPEEQKRGVYSIGEGITGRVVETGQAIIVPRIADEPAFLNRTGSASRQFEDDFSFMCVPILRGRKVLGTISAERRYDDPKLLDWMRLAAIEHEMLVEALRRSQGNTSAAAKALGLTRRTMGLRMKRFDLTYRQFRPGAAA